MDGPRIALVACGATKLHHRAPAQDLYIGALFQAARAYAEQCCDHWYILSAKHGLVDPETALDPYDQAMSKDEHVLSRWAERVCSALVHEWGSITAVTWVLLAGEKCTRALRPLLVQIHRGDRTDLTATWNRPEVPLARLGIGLQLQWLKREVAA
jgi:hypothetical protein